MTALDLRAAALARMMTIALPDGSPAMSFIPAPHRMKVAEAAAREVMAEVTRVLVAVRDQADGYADSTMAAGAVAGINRAAERLGVDLDAALAKEEYGDPFSPADLGNLDPDLPHTPIAEGPSS